MNLEIDRIIKSRKTCRVSSWDKSGKNSDRWLIQPKSSVTLADIKGPGRITHIWMAQPGHYRECLLKITWDNAKSPSVICPLGDFFGLGHGMIASYQSFLFSASAKATGQFGGGCALNSYAPMPFRERAVLELVNESNETHAQWFYVDYESLDDIEDDVGYFHAEFRRANPFQGWGPEIPSNKPGCEFSNVANKGRMAWDNNYVILQTKGCGHYIGCNLSITNFRGDWWGEGDDMIWVDGYKWPPDIHGTGSEDYLNQGWGMQNNAFLRNGSSIFEGTTTLIPSDNPWNEGAYQTSYVFHLENPIRFRKEIKVTIEHGHANHLANEVSSVAYWYADKPTAAVKPPSVSKRMPVRRDNHGAWLFDRQNQCPGKPVKLSAEMKTMKKRWVGQKT
ncbi:MAG: DUF2961 domain-containing protein [Lentisphaerae bacterium]|nr:DUF2961 domain-containing protein [Lentisphaerota bacterium]